MATDKFPVSFEVFKKFTYYEECTEFLLKRMASGNQEMYEKLVKNRETRELALRKYYEAFYLKPLIRDRYHIRIKSVPKRMKDKLLSIPLLDSSMGSETVKECEKEDINKSHVKGSVDNNSRNHNVALKENDAKRVKSKGRILLPLQDACDDQLVEDDSEPLSSSDLETNCANTHEKLKSSAEKQKEKESSPSSKATDDKDISNTCVMEKDNEENPKTSGNMQQNNEKHSSVSIPTSTNDTPKLKYKELIPYIHCCPLTLKDFCKYSNINKLVREFCEKQMVDAGQQRVILDRFYILFYLAPEHRSMTPFNKIQLLENCPPHIKDKFFSTPTRLYLKERNATNATNGVNQATGLATVPQTNIPAAANQLQVKSPVKNIGNGKLNNTAHQKLQLEVSKTADSVVSNVHCEINNATEQIINLADNTHSTLISKNSKEINSIDTEQIIIPAPTIPVSLDEFKKYFHYEEIVEKLFRSKAQNNEDLYLKYKNSQEAFDKTLENYYRAFYCLPAIREMCPIRTKAMPNFLKTRLLRIPEGADVISLNNFKLDQLVSPELDIPAASEEEVTNRNLSAEKPIEKHSKEVDAANKSASCHSSPPTSYVKTLKIEKDTKSLDNKSNSPLVGSKRANEEINESPSSKRQKIQEAQNNENNSKNKKESYKELLPYAHCCPISFSEFCKYTNISDLFSGYCQKRYKSVKKLPFMLKRAYILYYLAPKNRSFKPFISLKVLDNCPIYLRDKIFEIPKNLYLKNEKRNEEKVQTEIGTQTQTTIKMEEIKTTNDQQEITNGRFVKEPINILENRLLSPAKLPISSNKEGRCVNITCVFHHICHLDFLKQTNILSILPRPHEISIIQNTFKKFVYKIIKEQGCDDDYIVNGALLCKLLKFKNICEKCENDVLNLLSLDTPMASSESERIPNAANKTISEGCHVNNERTQSTSESNTNEEQEEASHNPIIDKSLKTNESETLANGNQVQQEATKQQHKDLCKYLLKDKIFSVFSKKLLEKLNQSLDEAIDFSSETYKIFLQCNEIPLRQILNEFSDNNEDIVQRILKETELCDALHRYYYSKYLTNKQFALKYPVKIKQNVLPESCFQTTENNSKSLNENKIYNKNLVGNQTNSNFSQTTLTQATNIQKENSNNFTLSQENISNSQNNPLEKAKRIFFRNVEKSNTLFYTLRTSFGLKQLILRSVLSLTFKEFIENTSVYEGQELYADKIVAECMYRYVFQSPLVWPTNLFVKLEYLCKFLQAKNIRFDDYSTMLRHISPKLLHWSVLLACTNFVDCVGFDFERRTGKLLNTYDTKSLKQECIEYYNRCWKHEKWLGQLPLVNEEFYKNFSNDNLQGDVAMLDEPAVQRVNRYNVAMLDEPDVQRVCNDGAETSSNVDAVGDLANNILPEDEVEVTAYMVTTLNADRPVDVFNCVMLPDTQQQLEMLTVEEEVSKDPLNDSNSASNLNSSSSTNELYEVVSVGELTTQPVKTEQMDKPLLSNLLFYEDDNSNLQCIPCEEIIYDLDNTLKSQEVGENLPPSQIDFEEAPLDVWMNSDTTNSLMNLAQQPSSGVVNDATINQQPETSTHILQLPDVSLKSSGENDNPENVQDHGKKDKIILEHEFCRLSPSYTYSGDLSAEPANTPFQQEQQEIVAENVNAPIDPIDEQQEVNIVNEQHPSALIIVQPLKPCDQLSDLTEASLPKGSVRRKKNVANKIKKDIVKVKPLHTAALVPQIQHTTRPLQTKPLFTTTSSKDNNDMKPVTTLLKLSLTPTKSTSNPTEQPTKNASIQFQLSPLGTHIYISQELNTNCSVFDNTSLLRIADHDYYQQNTTNLMSASPQEQQVPAVSNTTKQTVLRSARRNSTCPNITTTSSTNKQTDNTIEQPARRVVRKRSTCTVSNTQPKTSSIRVGSATKNDFNSQVSSRIVTRRSSVNKDINDKNFFVRYK